MADYIDRNRLKQGIAEDALITLSDWDSNLMDLVMLDIDEIPAADVAPVVHGRWTWETADIYRCSACKIKSHVKEVMSRPAWDFCPNCGAKMDLI